MYIGLKIWELVPSNIGNLQTATAFKCAIKNANRKTALVDNARLTFTGLI